MNIISSRSKAKEICRPKESGTGSTPVQLEVVAGVLQLRPVLDGGVVSILLVAIAAIRTVDGAIGLRRLLLCQGGICSAHLRLHTCTCATLTCQCSWLWRQAGMLAEGRMLACDSVKLPHAAQPHVMRAFETSCTSIATHHFRYSFSWHAVKRLAKPAGRWLFLTRCSVCAYLSLALSLSLSLSSLSHTHTHTHQHKHRDMQT